MWYVYFETDTGKLRSQGKSYADVADLPDGWGRKEYTERPEGFDWNAETLDFDIEQPKRVEPITAVQFMRRFTVEERIAIREQRAVDPVLDDFFDLLVVAGSVRVDDPDMMAGVGYLVLKGLVSIDRTAQLLKV
jgi:hypothetical protein